MKVIGGLAVHTSFVFALFIFVELLESILCICIVFNVVALVLLYVTLVFEGEAASWTPAMEVSSLLAIELAVDCATVLSGSEALKAIVNQLGILLMEVFMCHYI